MDKAAHTRVRRFALGTGEDVPQKRFIEKLGCHAAVTVRRSFVVVDGKKVPRETPEK
jgi:hypothetical protein